MIVGLDLIVAEWLKTRRGQVVGSRVTCVAMTAAALFVVPIGVRQLRLANTATGVRADVVDTHAYYDDNERTKPRRAAVRYAFATHGRPYHFNGAGGNEWASVSVERLDAASRDRTIDVAYDPADPANNAPLDALPAMGRWAAGFVAVPPVLATLAWVWAVRVWRDPHALRR